MSVCPVFFGGGGVDVRFFRLVAEEGPEGYEELVLLNVVGGFSRFS